MRLKAPAGWRADKPETLLEMKRDARFLDNAQDRAEGSIGMEWDHLIETTMYHCERWLSSLPHRPVSEEVDHEALRTSLDLPLSDDPVEVNSVIEELVTAVEPGLVASPGPRYFGFVTGGSHPVALAADWLTSAWDQVAASYVGSPSAAVIEETAARWVLELLDLPRASSVGFTTGATGANFTALAAARQALLAGVGWDLEERGLTNAPAVHIVTSEQRHSTIDVVLRLLGIGAAQVTTVPVDDQGRADPAAFADALDATEGLIIAIAQAGNVATGSFDPLEEIARAAATRGAWLHVDGAFGLWARASQELRSLTVGAEAADSWAVDAHKWLNVPYDCGIVVVRNAAAHYAATKKGGSYAMTSEPGRRDGEHWVPEFSRRARATPVYAVLRALGRRGVNDLVTRACDCARRFADAVRTDADIEVLNEVVLNQVLLAFPSAAGDERLHTTRILQAVQSEGTFWAGSTEWGGRLCMRVSISGWATTERDVDRAATTLRRIVAAIHEAP